MIDRTARQAAASAIAAYMRGEVDNFALDDALSNRWADPSLNRIAQELWFTYDDCKSHPISVSRDGWQLHKRCIAFLSSNYELPTNAKHDTCDHSIWPFQNRRQLVALRPDLSSYGLPRFDQRLHDVPIRSRVEILLLTVLWILLVAVMLLAGARWLAMTITS